MAIEPSCDQTEY